MVDRKAPTPRFTRQGPLVRSQYRPPIINSLGNSRSAHTEKIRKILTRSRMEARRAFKHCASNAARPEAPRTTGVPPASARSATAAADSLSAFSRSKLHPGVDIGTSLCTAAAAALEFGVFSKHRDPPNELQLVPRQALELALGQPPLANQPTENRYELRVAVIILRVELAPSLIQEMLNGPHVLRRLRGRRTRLEVLQDLRPARPAKSPRTPAATASSPPRSSSVRASLRASGTTLSPQGVDTATVRFRRV